MRHNFIAVGLASLISVGCSQSALAPSTQSASNGGVVQPLDVLGSAPTFNEFPYQGSSSDGGKMVIGPDNNLWFPDRGTDSIGTVTMSGAITEYPLPHAGIPLAVVSGPGSALWATQAEPGGSKGWIVKITTSGVTKSFRIPFTGSGAGVNRIAAGADGDLWFTSSLGCASGECVGRMTPSGQFSFFPTTGYPGFIAEGSDGNVWFTESAFGGPPLVGRVTSNGTVTEFAVPTSTAGDIIAAGDGNLYYAADRDHGSSKVVQVITATGAMTIVAHFQGWLIGLGANGPTDIRMAAQNNGCRIRKLTLSGFHLSSIALPTGECAWSVTRGPDRNLWYQDGPNPNLTEAVGEVVFH